MKASKKTLYRQIADQLLRKRHITEGLAALGCYIKGFLALLGWRKPAQALSSACLLMSPARSPLAVRSDLLSADQP